MWPNTNNMSNFRFLRATVERTPAQVWLPSPVEMLKGSGLNHLPWLLAAAQVNVLLMPQLYLSSNEPFPVNILDRGYAVPGLLICACATCAPPELVTALADLQGCAEKSGRHSHIYTVSGHKDAWGRPIFSCLEVKNGGDHLPVIATTATIHWTSMVQGVSGNWRFHLRSSSLNDSMGMSCRMC